MTTVLLWERTKFRCRFIVQQIIRIACGWHVNLAGIGPGSIWRKVDVSMGWVLGQLVRAPHAISGVGIRTLELPRKGRHFSLHPIALEYVDVLGFGYGGARFTRGMGN